MKYAPKKVFIIKDGGYQELTYEAYCALCESDSSYKDKRFIPLHGMLMEVTEDDFKEFYRNQRRQKYLEERSINNQDISIDMLPTQEFRDRDVLFDSDQDVAEKVLNNIFLDKLREVLPLLDAEDQKLLWLRHGQELSEQKLGEIYGVSQQAISKRLRKLYDKPSGTLKTAYAAYQILPLCCRQELASHMIGIRETSLHRRRKKEDFPVHGSDDAGQPHRRR